MGTHNPTSNQHITHMHKSIMVCMYAISYTHPPSSIYHALMHEGPFLSFQFIGSSQELTLSNQCVITTPYMVIIPMRKTMPYTVLRITGQLTDQEMPRRDVRIAGVG